jgi:hypothetical protein
MPELGNLINQPLPFLQGQLQRVPVRNSFGAAVQTRQIARPSDFPDHNERGAFKPSTTAI